MRRAAILCAQVVLRHGQLHMCRNQERVRSGKDGRGLFIVINGLVRIGYRDPLGNTQEYFLGTGAPPTPTFCPVSHHSSIMAQGTHCARLTSSKAHGSMGHAPTPPFTPSHADTSPVHSCSPASHQAV